MYSYIPVGIPGVYIEQDQPVCSIEENDGCEIKPAVATDYMANLDLVTVKIWRPPSITPPHPPSIADVEYNDVKFIMYQQ